MHPNSYKTFKALGLLLCYPSKEWLLAINDICNLIDEEHLLSAKDVSALRDFAAELSSSDLFDVQELYVDTFDRIRSLSLHLFEHVHGESRDRGQAMVDLAERYKEQGFSLAESELPDYLPVFLEYLSLLPKEEAIEELSNTGHILSSIGKRLAERGNSYSAVFDALTRLAGLEPEKVIRKITPEPLSFIQMDKEWEDKPIDFMGAEAPQAKTAGGCGGGTGGCGGGGCGGKTQNTENRI